MIKVDKRFREQRKLLAAEDRRQCTQCGEVKKLSSDFGVEKNGANGRSGHCRDCHNSRSRQWYNAFEGLQGALDNGAKRARIHGSRCSIIKPERLLKHWERVGVDPWKCFYTGAPLVREGGHPNSREIDHIEPLSLAGSAGHVKTNVVPCSHEWNQHKNTRRAVDVVMSAPEKLRPIQSYVGLKGGHAGVDSFGNPLAPALVEWSRSDHECEFVVYLRNDGEVTS